MTEPAGGEDADRPWAPPFISRVRLTNYKSIADCDVRLGPLTLLVGPNGSGKSNFLDALALVARALETTPNEAIDERGGMPEIARRVPSPTDSFSVGVEVVLPWGAKAQASAHASYEFEVGRVPGGGPSAFEIINEACELRRGDQAWRFRARHGQVLDETRTPQAARVPPDRLYLAFAGTQIFFEPLYRRLQDMCFYNFNLEVLRQPQQRPHEAILDQRGEHLADVIGALAEEGSGYKERVDAYLRAIVPEAVGIDRWFVGPYATVMLRSMAGLGGRDVVFGPDGMSDGTIRAAAVLAALFQPATRDGRVSLVGIEEPEIALHPAAAGVLFDALTEASEHVQVLATTQSADLLDRDDLDVSIIRPVVMRDGLTVIGEVDDASREIVEKKLYTLGELMRGSQLAPKPPR